MSEKIKKEKTLNKNSHKFLFINLKLLFSKNFYFFFTRTFSYLYKSLNYNEIKFIYISDNNCIKICIYKKYERSREIY
jgi:hypothetical protein